MSSAQHLPNRLLFYFRRLCLMLRSPSIKVLIVDIDETFLDNFSTFQRGLEIVYGKRNGGAKYDKLMREMGDPNNSAENLMIKCQQLLIEGRFSKVHLEKIAREAEENINIKLLKVLLRINRNKKIKIILATKSSEKIAKSLAKKFNFYGGIGTKMVFDKSGNFIKTKHLIADKKVEKGEYFFRNKIDEAIEYCKENKLRLRNENVAIITDAISDLPIMKQAGLSILFVPDKHSQIQGILAQNRLFDYKINESQLNQLETILSDK